MLSLARELARLPSYFPTTQPSEHTVALSKAAYALDITYEKSVKIDVGRVRKCMKTKYITDSLLEPNSTIIKPKQLALA